jgi:DNA relaxase NicK
MSRVDYCVTALDTSGALHPDEEYWSDWLAGGRAIHGRTTAERRQRDDGNAVFYAGRRSSAVYRRCYDKGKEDAQRYPAGAWRWEVELKSYASEREHARITSGQVHQDYPRRLVAAAFAAVGLPVPFSAASESIAAAPKRAPSDADKSLDWLAVSIAPTVEWLRTIGRLDSTLTALRLSDLIPSE